MTTAKRIGIAAIQRMLLKHAFGPIPEKSLIVAIICQAIQDCSSIDKNEQISARAFLLGRDLEAWSTLVDLDADFVRSVAIKTRYLIVRAT
jgi:hypothetical protein